MPASTHPKFGNMTFLLKIVYYGLMAAVSLGNLFFFGSSLIGVGNGSVKIGERLCMLVASLVAGAILYQAYRVGHVAEAWGTGIAYVFAALVAFLEIYSDMKER